MSASGVSREKNVGTDGVTYLLNRRKQELSEIEFGYLLEYNLSTCENQSLLGYSLHGLFIGRKR